MHLVYLYTQAAKDHRSMTLDQCQMQAPMSNSECKIMGTFTNIESSPVEYYILF